MSFEAATESPIKDGRWIWAEMIARIIPVQYRYGESKL
jgi:hypothetical protein